MLRCRQCPLANPDFALLYPQCSTDCLNMPRIKYGNRRLSVEGSGTAGKGRLCPLRFSRNENVPPDTSSLCLPSPIPCGQNCYRVCQILSKKISFLYGVRYNTCRMVMFIRDRRMNIWSCVQDRGGCVRNIVEVYRRLRNSVHKAEPVLINLSVTGTVSPSVLRCRILAPYVPLRTRCSESVPVTDRFISIGSTLRTEFRNCLVEV